MCACVFVGVRGCVQGRDQFNEFMGMGGWMDDWMDE